MVLHLTFSCILFILREEKRKESIFLRYTHIHLFFVSRSVELIFRLCQERNFGITLVLLTWFLLVFVIFSDHFLPKLSMSNNAKEEAAEVIKAFREKKPEEVAKEV